MSDLHSRKGVLNEHVSYYGVELLEPKILLSAAPIDAPPEAYGLSPLDAVDCSALEEVRFANVVECEASAETFMPHDVETSLLGGGEDFSWGEESEKPETPAGEKPETPAGEDSEELRATPAKPGESAAIPAAPSESNSQVDQPNQVPSGKPDDLGKPDDVAVGKPEDLPSGKPDNHPEGGKPDGVPYAHAYAYGKPETPAGVDSEELRASSG